MQKYNQFVLGGKGGCQISATWQVEQEMCASQNMPVYINYQTV